jgi:hypothetical protein
MSKLETPMTLRYWESVGGTLILEFPIVRRGPEVGRRVVDGLILPNADRRIAGASEVDVTDEDVIVVQTKAHRLGMYLMGQAFFSAELMKDLRPRSIRTVAICGSPDVRLQALCVKYGIEVVVDGGGEPSPPR